MLPNLPRLTPQEAEDLLLKSGFVLSRTKGSHRIYIKGNKRQVLPFHAGKNITSKNRKTDI